MYSSKGVQLDIPAEFRVSSTDVRGRMDVMSCSPRVRMTTPNPGDGWLPGNTTQSIVFLSSVGTSRDPDVAWAAQVFCEDGLSALRGPIIILDPTADYKDAQSLPFLAKERQEPLLEAARNGLAQADKLIDPNDHRQKPWGAVVGLPTLHDPLKHWRGFTGGPNLLPAKYLHPRSERRLCLAHELAHFHEEAMGLKLGKTKPEQSEAFAEAVAIQLFIRDGGSSGEAMLHIYRRAIGALYLDGPYACSPLLSKAFEQAIKWREDDVYPSTREIMEFCAKLAHNFKLPDLTVMRETFPGLDRETDWHEWMKNLPNEIEEHGVLACHALKKALIINPAERPHAISQLSAAWHSIMRDAEIRSVPNLHSRLQKLSETRLRLFSGEAEVNLEYQDFQEISSVSRIANHLVVSPAPDQGQSICRMSLFEKLDILRASDDIHTKADIALSMLLDENSRKQMDKDTLIEVLEIWGEAHSNRPSPY
jgi:hypothetical protein